MRSYAVCSVAVALLLAVDLLMLIKTVLAVPVGYVGTGRYVVIPAVNVNKSKRTTPGIPTWSPTVVLTGPDDA
jgi:hypothetical protein